ncbi:MAG TPA: NAD(P)H-quinone oxidoreductase [Chthoniobacterales bacterium]|nr:NAD(P)H-quinone oxidoreductase [Chthoniobacterales bacterium]
MRAVVINSFGGIEGIDLQDVPTPPPPTADRIRIRVHAAGLNRADIMQREGKYPPPPGYPENIPGLEFAGEVEAVGAAVRAWQTGDRVFGITGGGAQAELVVVAESNLARIPRELDWNQAAAMPEVFITAHDALFTRARLQMGERALIHAAGSGVGTAAVQLAHAAGATVYGTSRTAAKLAQARTLGLDESITVGESPQEFVERVQELTNGAGVEVILDLVGGAYFPANLEVLAPRGRLICVGTTAGRKSKIDLGLVLRKRATIVGTVLRARSIEEKAEATHRFSAHVLPLVSRGVVRPVVERVYPAAEVRAAHQHLESNRSCGKIVLDFSV